jgi:sacsin
VAEYQGPSLLAYNNATFSEQDFTSLSRIGDSCKQNDGSTTGKFGRGFNAVYNWTDSPSILSQDSLLILDPHITWTKHFPNPGGPRYDFVKEAKDGTMRDQMAAFSPITEEFDQPFGGTIIRIPLRTPEQAEKSQICGRRATFSEVAEVMQTFADDFGHTGLLFMKNVSQISITIGDKAPINICICNDEEVRR